ncbi:hypothetical protein [uncultured Pseudodesulfovibrio sp.]|uniref:hypothetical protein n=1 Tax=uncultured Pseudodesulfovibrio sp. TaxID=2035858 RepID=UPI0029C7DB9D|nr:hypothetical protein [uncultured Pseudodesulfovibrio sp.]
MNEAAETGTARNAKLHNPKKKQLENHNKTQQFYILKQKKDKHPHCLKQHVSYCSFRPQFLHTANRL